MEAVRSKKVGLVTMILFLGFFGVLGAIPAWSSNGLFVEDELLIQFKAGIPEEKIHGIIKEHGAFADDEISQIRVKKLKVPAHALESVKAALSHNPHINFVENNHIANAAFTPNDIQYTSQWQWPKMLAPQAWDMTNGSNNVVIAVVDSGVDPAHPDLAGKLVAGWNFLAGNTDTHDVLGHGTAVAGTAGALSNNGVGVTGMAWANPIMPLVVLDATDYASYSNIASAITYAADHGARVINISIGGSSSSSTLQNAVNYAWNKGVIIFASAMNNANSTPYYPAACNNVISVSATNSSDALASFSSYGAWVDISAPGANIYTTNNGGGYGAWNGTSFASPMAAGLAALMLSVKPSLANDEVASLIMQNADDLGTPGYDQYFGWGRINAYRSVLAAQNYVPVADTTVPLVSIASPANGATVSASLNVNVSATDNVGVTKAELYIDGLLFATDTTSAYSFVVDTTKYANGLHDVMAKAYDAAGNTGAATISVTVNNAADNTPPAVSITSPASGSAVGTKVSVKAGATDNVGVSRIELYIDGSLKAAATGTRVAYTWNTRNVPAGAHTISTKAYDAAGNVGTSSVTVYK